MTENKKDESLYLSGQTLTEMLQAVQGRGADFRFQATGISMIPAIKPGDTITLSQAGKIAPRKGEIAAFIQPNTGRLLVHRIHKVTGKHFIIKGDNINSQTNKVPGENIVGIVTAILRENKARYWPNRNFNPYWSGLYTHCYLLWVKITGLLRKSIRSLRE